MLKACSNCSKVWENLNEFLSDPEVELVGYQFNYKKLELGFFLFNHSCKTTISMAVENFSHLYNGIIFSENKHNSDECLRYCLDEKNLNVCSVQCECAYIREIMQIIRTHSKK